ncbi:hypothetical protein O165_005505 [Pseudomonas soli]|nr:hypothetical protein O165_005505 [Pseudomonas soli]
MELAKELLEIIVTEDNGGNGLYRSEIHAVFAERYPHTAPVHVDAVNYHLHILDTAGLVKATYDEDVNLDLDNFEMTWAGHDLLDAK